MTFSDDFEISSMEELIELIDEVGFVPFFQMRYRASHWRSILRRDAGMTMLTVNSGRHGNGKVL
ncbi:hypothetical protein [Oribacterium sp. KHPX15]|uniref:hypothetical protein n=1 Tax=Oribacterium sp. KHPX15 TaxID=1855342 RepID=UPI000B85D43E|nr:hypothetical protein [Oribacterium sp. KHPX15]